MGFSVAHYLGSRRVVTRTFLPAMVEAFGPLWIIMLCIPLLAVAGIAWRGRRRVERMLEVAACRHGELVDIPGMVVAAGLSAGLRLHEECAALIAGVRHGRLVSHASFFQQKNVRAAIAGGDP